MMTRFHWPELLGALPRKLVIPLLAGVYLTANLGFSLRLNSKTLCERSIRWLTSPLLPSSLGWNWGGLVNRRLVVNFRTRFSVLVMLMALVSLKIEKRMQNDDRTRLRTWVFGLQIHRSDRHSQAEQTLRILHP